MAMLSLYLLFLLLDRLVDYQLGLIFKCGLNGMQSDLQLANREQLIIRTWYTQIQAHICMHKLFLKMNRRRARLRWAQGAFNG